MKSKGMLLLLLVALLLGWLLPLLVAPPAAARIGVSDLSWNVVASGGQTMSSASYTLDGTLGQPTAGEAGSGRYALLGGYWTEVGAALKTIFMPLVRADP